MQKQSIALQSKSMYWFLYNKGHYHEKVHKKDTTATNQVPLLFTLNITKRFLYPMDTGRKLQLTGTAMVAERRRFF